MPTAKEHRIRAKKTQLEMAVVIGVTTSAYADKERGRRKFNVEEAVLFCRELSLSIEDVDEFCPQLRDKRIDDLTNPRHKRAG